jgi:hypothetical protein
MPSPFRLTPEIESAIVSYIRSGGYPWVAAEGAGIPRRMFAQWMRRGAKARSGSRWRHFYIMVMQARAQARLAAELETRKKDPRSWLTHGPGKERPGAPGWTNPSKAPSLTKKKAEDVVATEKFLELVGPVLEALAPFPEARAAVAWELDRLSKGRSRGRRRTQRKTQAAGGQPPSGG